MSNYNEISSLIWNACDDVLRGLFKQNKYGDVILPFLVLRRLDCIIEPNKERVIKLYKQCGMDNVDPTPIIKEQFGLQFYNHSNFDLERLKGDPNGLKINFQSYLKGFSQNVFEITKLYELQKYVDKLLKNNKLYQLIHRFTAVDLHPDKIDNHTMGQVFEELLRRFSEMSNESSGEHYTPRDVVKLLTSFVFSQDSENLKGKGIIRSIFDPCCGTGGMLTIGKEWIQRNIERKIRLNLYGQEKNDQTFALCKSDMLITGENPENIKLGCSLSEDHFRGKKFDYMITNPPFGVSWKSEKEFVQGEAKNAYGRFSVGTPRTSDGSLLFLQHMISKMEDKGSRIGIVFNGSPLFTGDAGSGESNIRRWIIEKDWLECIVSLPDQLFFNTGISTYIWIVTNNKKPHRKGKVQLIDGSSFYKSMKKSLGNKRKYIDDSQREDLLNIYESFKESNHSKIFDNNFFGYTKVTIEQPKVENGQVVRDRNGDPKPDSKLRDHERVPLSEDIDEYFFREVKPHLPNSWIDCNKNKVGYEINFTKYFYKYKPLRSSEEIARDLLELDKESENLLNQILN